MGKEWDGWDNPASFQRWATAWARECLRVLKPGGHILAFGGSRTWHRLAVAIEDAGFEIRDGVLWLYGSGFPKSHDVSKAIDKAAGATREVVGTARRSQNRSEGWDRPWMREQMDSLGGSGMAEHAITAPATSEAKQWEGWGTALKPAYEPAVMARKPFKGTVAANVLEHGTGAINIDASRIRAEGGDYNHPGNHGIEDNTKVYGTFSHMNQSAPHDKGRFPANLILDEHTAELLDQQSGTSKFFYVAKAPKSERPNVDGVAHPTVKPLKLMRYLVRMVTPPNGVVLDPFAGSGTTIEAALIEGFNVIGIERETDYLPLIQHRINRAKGLPDDHV